MANPKNKHLMLWHGNDGCSEKKVQQSTAHAEGQSMLPLLLHSFPACSCSGLQAATELVLVKRGFTSRERQGRMRWRGSPHTGHDDLARRVKLTGMLHFASKRFPLQRGDCLVRNSGNSKPEKLLCTDNKPLLHRPIGMLNPRCLTPRADHTNYIET